MEIEIGNRHLHTIGNLDEQLLDCFIFDFCWCCLWHIVSHVLEILEDMGIEDCYPLIRAGVQDKKPSSLRADSGDRLQFFDSDRLQPAFELEDLFESISNPFVLT